MNIDFWRNKKVFLTGHTGFKGGWLALWLTRLGAQVTGYSLAPKSAESFFSTVGLETVIDSYIDDINNGANLKRALAHSKPDIVFHLAAQALVQPSYDDPVETYLTNVMGTVNLLEAVRTVETVQATLVVTTDKVYENKEWQWGYREIDQLGGYDPYSTSKACTELVVSSYLRSFFSGGLATARAGNVIGGGDWSPFRLVPDVVKSIVEGKPISIRNPGAIRPWQHVLDPIWGYILLAEKLFNSRTQYASSWNFGPDLNGSLTVAEVVDHVINAWGVESSEIEEHDMRRHEAGLLKLDCSKARGELGWEPAWNPQVAVTKTVEWYKAFNAGEQMLDVSEAQITLFERSLSRKF